MWSIRSAGRFSSWNDGRRPTASGFFCLCLQGYFASKGSFYFIGGRAERHPEAATPTRPFFARRRKSAVLERALIARYVNGYMSDIGAADA